MSDFIAKLYDVLQATQARKEAEKAGEVKMQIRFLENVVTSISSKLRISASMVKVLSHNVDNNIVFLQIDEVFFRLSPRNTGRFIWKNVNQYDLYLTNFFSKIDNKEGFSWQDEKICPLPNLDIEILAEKIFSKFSVGQLVITVADSQAAYGSNDKQVLIDRKLARIFDTDDVVRLTELNTNPYPKKRWMYRVGHRVIAYYLEAAGDCGYSFSSPKFHPHDLSLHGYTNNNGVPEAIEVNIYLFEHSNNVKERIKEHPNVVFAAKEAMQVLGLKPTVATKTVAIS